MAVCNWKLARYINSLLPVNDTIRLPIFTSLAPSWVSSFASTGSSPINVLAINSKFCSIDSVSCMPAYNGQCVEFCLQS